MRLHRRSIPVGKIGTVVIKQNVLSLAGRKPVPLVSIEIQGALNILELSAAQAKQVEQAIRSLRADIVKRCAQIPARPFPKIL